MLCWCDSSGLGGGESGSRIVAQMFDAAGVKLGSVFVVNTDA